MAFDLSRNGLSIAGNGWEIVLNKVINDWGDSCHIQHNIHIGFEPELLAVMMECFWTCRVIIFINGPFETIQADAILPNCQLFSFVQGAVCPVQSDLGRLQRQQIWSCVVDMN